MRPTGKPDSEPAVPPSPGAAASGSTVPRSAPATPDGAGAVAGPAAAPGKIHAAAQPAWITHRDCPPPHALPGCACADMLSPAARYCELFVDVQHSGLFADSKTFPDCIPNCDPDQIVARYRETRDTPGFSLADFVQAYFTRATVPDSHYVSDPASTLREHIDGLWPVLTRAPVAHPPLSSLLPLPHRYVVPGGRFGELYYWDSYFTMQGLARSGHGDLMVEMTRNFAYLLDTYGLVPNGTRNYYLSRSQPPVFALMVDLLEREQLAGALDFLPQLRREYAFWMDGADGLCPGHAHRRVVCLPDGALLNRYWDDRPWPREEAFLEDMETALRSGRPHHMVFRDLRAAAESGWDFSSRWLDAPDPRAGQPADLATIRTTAMLPVDLNALLWHLETRLAALCEQAGDAAAEAYRAAAQRREAAILQYLWDGAAGVFIDYDWCRGAPRRYLTAATVMPLYLGLASPAQAQGVARAVQDRLLVDGGLATTECTSGQQWDHPNGWAPLQWLAVCGLERYGHDALAGEIARRWLATVASLYTHECKLVEKYRIRRIEGAAHGGGGGEYPLQDGFGWTNAVAGALMARYGEVPATCRADGVGASR
ncbi:MULTISPECIES: alpha,alpha-trehalase TreF [Cupriavidus]|uniref:Cytoplasmic trehalase n=1 Tax=Cupriavidus taiwanensis TaxID=164546 RepID=A0A9Q7V1D0_9BURK|nr:MULTISPECIES: alpha,alpha-trehalase TreF [Cupriavidus]MEC3764560.1 alpha,alpha-trehalase TreF [Cupriavidus sp. SS-3]SPD68492.1 cytoplasmic trehalase [Cupriavidus taiwanensis]